MILFIFYFLGDYKEYLQAAMAARIPIVAHRDHFNLINFMDGKIPKAYQMRPRGKLADMDLNDGIDIDIEMFDTKADDILKKYENNGYPVDMLAQTSKDQFDIPLGKLSKILFL